MLTEIFLSGAAGGRISSGDPCRPLQAGPDEYRVKGVTVRTCGRPASVSPLPTEAHDTRLGYGLPYFLADIALNETVGWIDYSSRRRDVTRAEFAARYQPTGPVAEAAPGSLEFFLAERYLLYSRSGRGLRTARVHHAPYPLQPAAATGVYQTLTYVASLSRWICREDTHGPPLVHYAREVEVQIFGPRHLDNPRAVR